MPVVLKSSEELERMRIAGRLASEVLDFITPHVKPGVTTGRLNDLCHDYMVKVQGTLPAPLNYAPPGYKPFPKSICTSVNHQVCHGIPGERVLKLADVLNIDITVIKDGFHGDCSRMFYVGEPSIQAKRLVDVTFECMWLGIRQVRPGARLGDVGAAIQAHAEKARLLGGARVLRPRHRPQVPRGAAGPALRQARRRHGARGRHDLHGRADDQCRQGRDSRARGRLDHRHQGPQPLGAVGAHGRGHAFRIRGSDPFCRGSTPAVTAALRDSLAQARQALRDEYLKNPKPRQMLARHADLIDHTVRALWAEAGAPRGAALVATGGYGRGELYPCSDIDLLILLAADPSEEEQAAIERLIGTLWDIGLEIGHSVRTVQGCVEAAAGDVTIATTLLEARHLAGSKPLCRKLEKELAEQRDAAAFFRAKKLEQEQRHAKHQDSPYALEPNLKEAPGGLRDLQVIQWIARAAGLGHRWTDLVAKGLVEAGEARSLAKHEALLEDCAFACTTWQAGARIASSSTCRPRSPPSSATRTRRRAARAK
jgi:methionine aminopeptidase